MSVGVISLMHFHSLINCRNVVHELNLDWICASIESLYGMIASQATEEQHGADNLNILDLPENLFILNGAIYSSCFLAKCCLHLIKGLFILVHPGNLFAFVMKCIINYSPIFRSCFGI